MEQIAFDIAVAILSFGGGLVVGAYNVVTIDKAISTVDAAEKSALAVLAKVTAHKTPAA